MTKVEMLYSVGHGEFVSETAIPIDTTTEKCVYVFDRKSHRSNIKRNAKYPSILAPELARIFGTLEDAIKIGYRPCILTDKKYVSRDYARNFYQKHGRMSA